MLLNSYICKTNFYTFVSRHEWSRRDRDCLALGDQILAFSPTYQNAGYCNIKQCLFQCHLPYITKYFRKIRLLCFKLTFTLYYRVFQFHLYCITWCLGEACTTILFFSVTFIRAFQINLDFATVCFSWVWTENCVLQWHLDCINVCFSAT